MKINRLNIGNIPSIIWGEKSIKVFIAVHGNMSNKEDEVIKILAEKVVLKGYQLLSFDLPEHEDRKDNKEYLCKVQNCVNDLKQVIEYVKENPIIKWNKQTNILYSNKDNMQEQTIIQDFSNKFNCELSLLENGEHYFHTEEQLDYYKNWLDKVL